MKISNYTTIFRKDNVYLLHNSMVNSTIRIYDSEYQSFIDTIQDGHYFDMDESDQFYAI